MENTDNKKVFKALVFLVLLGVLAAASAIAVYLYFFDFYKPVKVTASTFAAYVETPVTVTPKIPAYAVKPDLSNLINPEDAAELLPEARSLLAKNAFVVKPSYHPEFFSIYEINRYGLTPNFVTADSMLHNYHLFFDHLLKRLEEEKLAGELKSLNAGMLAEAQAQYQALKGTEWENAARRNLGFFAVGSKLFDPAIAVPREVKSEVEKELALIEAHAGIAETPVMNLGGERGAVLDTPQGALGVEALKEDYSQYIPRGHYDKTEELKRYFKSMMWYGRLSFRLKSEDEIKSALLITLGLGKESNQASWNKIYEPVNFFVGKSDDITYYQFSDLAKKTYGENISLSSLTSDKSKLAAFVEATKTLEPPQINSMPVFNAEIQPDREREIKGFRFMGQKFTIDASIFQRLIDREVSGRMLPKGLDISAALGSTEALNILTAMGETDYPKYSENMGKLRAYIAGLPNGTWTQNLYWGWLNALRPLTEVKPEGYPSFMRNTAWTRKELSTFLGSWTELKHDTILYAKQAYAEMGGGGPDEKDDRGYVEPNPYVYARLTSLIKMTSEGLESRGLLAPAMKENLGKLEQLALSLKTISEKELANEKLTDAEYELIRSYGGQLEHFWLEVNKDEQAFKESGSQRDYLYENPAALVADVATDPNGQVLEEATGKISEIYAVVPIEGKLRVARGGVYSYYEFPWPLNDRLTDKKWREMLNEDKVPALPAWTDAFVAHK